MDLDLKNLKALLNKFGKTVVAEAKTNASKNSNRGKLSNSIKHKVDTRKAKNSLTLIFKMEEYGLYQDKGVKGAINPYTGKDGAKPYEKGKKYKFGTGTGKKGGLRKSILKWVEGKRFQFRETKKNGQLGRFMSYESTAYMISRSIWSKGIKPTLFFTKPFKKHYKNLPKNIGNNFKKDLAQMLKSNKK